MSDLGRGIYFLNIDRNKETADNSRESSPEGSIINPPTDIIETREGIEIIMELPGVSLPDLDVSISGSRLTVQGSKGKDEVEDGAVFSCMERVYGRFRKDFEISGALNSLESKASMVDGVLKIIVPRCEEKRGKRKKIEVTGEEIDEKEGILGKD